MRRDGLVTTLPLAFRSSRFQTTRQGVFAMDRSSRVVLLHRSLRAGLGRPAGSSATVMVEGALHPARLCAALLATAFVAAVAATVTACAYYLGVTSLMLPAVIGGITAVNAVLFLPPYALAGHSKRALTLLLVSVIPMPLATWLFHVSPPLAGAAVTITAAGAMLVRASGPIAAALAMMTALNMLIPLVIGAEPILYLLTPIAGVIATAGAVVTDHIAVWLDRRFVGRADQKLLAETAATFLQELSRKLQDPASLSAAWISQHEGRVRAVMADLTMARPPGQLGPARAADYFVVGIARSAAALQGSASAPPSPLLHAACTATDGVAHALRGASVEDGVRHAATLIDRARSPMAEGDTDQAPQALGLAVLLRDFVHAVLDPIDPSFPVASAKGLLRPGPSEIRLALQVAVSLALAITLSNFLVGPKPYWIPLTTLVVSCASFGESLLKSLERTFGTVAGLLVGQLAWLLVGGLPGLMTGVVAIGIFGIFFSRNGPYRWTLFWMTVVLAALLHLAQVPNEFYLARFRDTLIGASIALAVGRLMWPLRTADAALAKRDQYLAAIAAQICRLAAHVDGERAAGGLDEQARAALAALHGMADAEILEAAINRPRRFAVRQRLMLADRLARSAMALGATLTLLGTEPDPVTAALITRLAGAAEGDGLPPGREAIRAHAAELIAATTGDDRGVERLTALLRVLRLIAVMSDSIAGLRGPAPVSAPAATLSVAPA